MKAKATYGRYPTLREVLDYYSRTDFLDFLLKTCATRKVCLVIPVKRHWEPQWREDRILATDRDSLSQFIVERIEHAFPDADPNERLPFYPSFHQSVVRSPENRVDEDGGRRDEIVESDLPAWREAFQDVFTLVSLLQDEGIPWRSKFSGSRSLHVMIPCGGDRLDPVQFGGSRAHRVPIVRMPYSLNEDTGLVSLPLTWDTLPVFRPWQANISAVEIDINDPWLAKPSEEELRRVAVFVSSAGRRPAVECRTYFDPRNCADERRHRARSLPGITVRADAAELSPGEKAWLMLKGEMVVTGADVVEAMASDDGEETRWLVAEAFLVHGRDLSRSALQALLDDHHPYVHSAAVDLVVMFEEQAISYFLEQMQADNMGAKARHLSLLARNQRLCLKLLAEAEKVVERSGALVHRLACVSGAAGRNWRPAMDMVRGAAAKYGNEPNWNTRVRALELMAEMTEHWSASALTQRARKLAELGPAIVDMLLLAYGSCERQWRRAFLVTLSDIGDERAMDVFIEALGDTCHDSARWATRALVRIGPPAVPALVEAAASDRPRIRRYAVRCLGHLKDPTVHGVIVEALQDSDDAVCRQAVVALGKFGRGADIDLIAEVARRRSFRVVEEAVGVLAAMGKPGLRTIEALAFEDGVQAAAAFLWQQGDAGGRDILLAALRDPGRGGDALRAIAENPVDDDMIDPLVDCIPLVEKWEIGDVAEALRRNGGERALDAVIDMARSGDRFHRGRAAITLGRWLNPRTSEMLIGMLGDKDRKVRTRTLRALVDQGEYARSAIEQFLADAGESSGKALGKMVLQAIDVRKRLDAGEPFTVDLVKEIARSHKQAWDAAVLAARNRASKDDVTRLLEILRTDNKPLRHCAITLLCGIGEPAREPVTRMFRQEPDGTTRDAAERVLDHLGPEVEPDDD